MKPCELCGEVCVEGMRFAKHAACFICIDKVVEFAVTAGMSFKEDEVNEPASS
jgi:hypothetical protein